MTWGITPSSLRLGSPLLATNTSQPELLFPGVCDELVGVFTRVRIRGLAKRVPNVWVTETALSTALNVSYMATQLALFSLVVGIALLLSGVGFIVLALAALPRLEAREGCGPLAGRGLGEPGAGIIPL